VLAAMVSAGVVVGAGTQPSFAASGSFREFAIPTKASRPFNVTTGPDGNIWFTETGAGKIGRITPRGVITEFPLGNSMSGPQDITTGPDGNL
jgi:virginiamycin B lyase